MGSPPIPLKEIGGPGKCSVPNCGEVVTYNPFRNWGRASASPLGVPTS
jgi:hypothetical protein